MNTRPLANRCIAVTRAADQADGLVEALQNLGASVLMCPTIAVVPPEDLGQLQQAARQLAGYHWLVLPSANAARALLKHVEDSRALATLRIAALGPATAAVVREAGPLVSLVPADYSATGLLREIGGVAGQRVLLPQSDIARPELAEKLRTWGALVDTVVAYRTLPGPGAAELATALQAGNVDAVTFASPSAVRYLLEGMQCAGYSPDGARTLLAQTRLAAIGPTTARALQDEHLPLCLVAEPHTAAGLVDGLVNLFAPADRHQESSCSC